MQRQQSVRKKSAGFTLIELMIVVAIIAVLAAIAIPQFLIMSSKAKRSEGIMLLSGFHKAQVSHYGSNDRYALSGLSAPGTLPIQWPTLLEFMPAGSTRHYVNLAYATGDETSPGSGIFKSYEIALGANLDSDSWIDGQTDDLLCIRSSEIPSASLFCGPPTFPSGVVYVYFDDVLNIVNP